MPSILFSFRFSWRRVYMWKIFFLCFALTAAADHSSNRIYAQIQDINHPSLQDYYAIQDYLTYGEREGLERLKDTEQRQKNLKIIGSIPEEMPQSGIIPVNTRLEEKENCLVLYASFNLHYPQGLKRIIEIVKKSDFKGHILYHLGGWPDLEGGSLVLAHVPHAFKACCLKEAQRLGYKRILWLDCSIIPLVSLNTIFHRIEEKGYFTVWNYHDIGSYCNRETAAYFGFTLKETGRLLSCQSGFIGVDLTSEQGKTIADSFYNAACDPNAFFSARSDQTVLSLILHRFHLTDVPDLTKVVTLRRDARADTLFIVDRPFVQY